MFEILADILIFRELRRSSLKTKLIFSFLVVGLFSIVMFLRQRNNEQRGLRNTRRDLIEMHNGIISYLNQMQRLPVGLEELVGNNPLKREWLYDGWGNGYKYVILDSINSKFIVFSAGKDGIFETSDDLNTYDLQN